MSEQMDAVKNWGDIALRLQQENAELRQALEASRAETREARDDVERVTGERVQADFATAAARLRLETAEGLLYSWLRADCRRLNLNLALSTEAFLSPPPGQGCWDTVRPNAKVTENPDGSLSCQTDGGRTTFRPGAWRVAELPAYPPPAPGVPPEKEPR